MEKIDNKEIVKKILIEIKPEIKSDLNLKKVTKRLRTKSYKKLSNTLNT